MTDSHGWGRETRDVERYKVPLKSTILAHSKETGGRTSDLKCKRPSSRVGHREDNDNKESSVLKLRTRNAVKVAKGSPKTLGQGTPAPDPLVGKTDGKGGHNGGAEGYEGRKGSIR